MTILGDIIIAIGIFCILIGLIGYMKYINFYTRILVTTKIETVGTITIILGVIVRHGFSFFSLKALLLLAVLVIINPLVSHVIARCAHLSGYELKNQSEKTDKSTADQLKKKYLS